MWSAVDQLVADGAARGLYAGAALVVRGPDSVLHETVTGSAEVRPRQRPAQGDTAWDLASLTKVLVAAPLAMQLVANLDQPIRELIEDAPVGVTWRHCLQHTSGLAAWAPLYEIDAVWGTTETRERVLAKARSVPPEAPPGTRALYSDLGFLLLTAALERLGGDRIDRLFERHVRSRGRFDLRWGWPDAAATEDCPVRRRVVVGEVHDLNAAVLGGLSGHAGLFGSAREVAAAAAWQLRAFHGAEEGLPTETVRAYWTAKGPGSHHLGWDGVSPGASSAGPRWPADGVGHTGFTGCSLWVAPERRIVVAFLANRVHPLVEGGSVPSAPVSPRYQAFKDLRPELHTRILAALGS
jgi:CubicO group peptidase (beta-lactamase class C family)